MNSSGKVIIGVIFGIIAAYIVLHVVLGVISGLFHFLWAFALPVLVVAAIGYGVYRVFSPRALGSSRRILP